ncbi:TonB family protein [Sphingomonas sanguinis]|uniref:energy transducer TonB family protein n=1 Tax=Sphingomonas sp. LC-1 TaxID=3110957 RepID=UPI0021BB6FA3|nr:energy transducer TonB [Sphingomonas sp. LC-1]MCT8002694.1 TonB family protein [Sphingomonas sp. LC-1]
MATILVSDGSLTAVADPPAGVDASPTGATTSRQASVVTGPPPLRYADRPPSLRARLTGAGGVLALSLVTLGGALVTWTSYRPVAPAPPMAVFDVAPPAAPPVPLRELPPSPEQTPKVSPEQPREQTIVEPPLVPMPTTNPVSVSPTKPAPDPVPPVEQTSAPEPRPMPPAPQPSNAAPTWQGQVLAALNKVRRYPREASFRRQQGVPYIRFVMDRDGRVLSARLERSSGVAALDSAAIALPKRAQPLPKPPAEVQGDTIELVVPVEFVIR